MFIVTMNIQMDLVPKEKADEHAGVVIVDVNERKELDEILSQNAYYSLGYAKAIMGKIS